MLWGGWRFEVARLFVPNFGFEDEIVGRDLSPAAATATRALNGCWAAFLGPTDLVCSEPYTQPGSVGEDGATSWAVVPWGWSRAMVRWAGSVSSVVNWPDPSVVEMLNRRRWGFAREKEIGKVPRGSEVVETVQACVNLLSKPSPVGLGWIVKSDLGASGRGQRRIGSCGIPEQFAAWVSSRLEQDGMVQVEPVLPVVGEFGIQYDVVATGKVILRGVTELLTTKSGAYRGTRIVRGDDVAIWGLSDVVEMLEPVVIQVAETGYTGPLGIDSMRYESGEGELAWRPVQDINARYTMGRCALEWSGELPVGTRGTVLVARWARAAAVDRCIAGLSETVPGLRRAIRFSPSESPPTTDAGLVLLVYDEASDAPEIEAAALKAIAEPSGG